MNIEIHTGDLTRVAVDAIVNAANESLLGGGGVDGAIHRAAGPELVAFCRRLGGCPPGEARVTPGFALPANWIIHTVGPIWRGGTTGEPQMLARCYRNCFDLAERHAFRRIAFPAISTGVYGYPLESATRIALAEATRARRRDTNIERVIFVCFDEAAAEVYQRLSNEQPGPTQVTDR